MDCLAFDSVQLHAQSGARDHFATVRTIRVALDELALAGLIEKSTTDNGSTVWRTPATGVVAEYSPVASAGTRIHHAIKFGPWLCLAMVLKVTHPPTRAALAGMLNTGAL